MCVPPRGLRVPAAGRLAAWLAGCCCARAGARVSQSSEPLSEPARHVRVRCLSLGHFFALAAAAACRFCIVLICASRFSRAWIVALSSGLAS